MRLVLDRPRPDVDVTLLVEAAIEGERVLLRPGALHEIMRLEIALPQQARVLAVGIAGVHRRADGEARDQPSARDAVDHRELFGHACRRIVERERVAHHAERGVGGAPREGTGNEVRRRHQPVAVGMMLVHADRVEADLGCVFELVHEVVVHVMRPARVEQRRMDVDPHRGMLLVEVVRKLRVRHQVKPHELHRVLPETRTAEVNERLPARKVPRLGRTRNAG